MAFMVNAVISVLSCVYRRLPFTPSAKTLPRGTIADATEDAAVEDMQWSCPKVRAVALFAANRMANNEGSHDFKHVLRVHAVSVTLARETVASGTPVDLHTVEMAALLHDVFDAKLYKQQQESLTGTELTKKFLTSLDMPATTVEKVAFIANNISYSKQLKKLIPKHKRSIEMDIVQDADRLDAMGAIGIARCFAYGGSVTDKMETSRKHFNDKILKLQPLMQTRAGARIATRRQRFLVTFLNHFDDEYKFAGQTSVSLLRFAASEPQTM